MQKLITVINGAPTDVDDLNQNLSRGWEVINFFPFDKGINFLLQVKISPQSAFPIYPGLQYLGSIILNHDRVEEGSLIITKDSKAYTVTKQS